jgi:hypothetical protein
MHLKDLGSQTHKGKDGIWNTGVKARRFPWNVRIMASEPRRRALKRRIQAERIFEISNILNFSNS